MNLASALIYRVLELNDFDTWTNVRKHYLPSEHGTLFDVITKHSEKYHKLPTVEELKLEVRDAATLDKVYALESIETEAEPYFLLEAVKSEYAQREALFQMDKWVDSSMAFETAEEVVRHIQQIGVELETKVELTPDAENMQKMSLFETEEEMGNRIVLGFNDEFDSRFNFLTTDYINLGGRRGAGKSILCSNVARTIVNRGKKALYFSIEMLPRELLHRDCSIATQVAHGKIRNKDMSVEEWEKVSKWWSERYVNGEDFYHEYLKHRSFDTLHKLVSKQPLVDAYVDIVYDSTLTIGRINAEVDKRIAKGEEIGVILVDYVQKVKRVAGSTHSINNLDWQEQIRVSNDLKLLAQDRAIPVVAPYQIDDTGEARFAKGILDASDAALTMKAHKGDVPCITFQTTKMRGADDSEQFTSEVNWNTVTVGPRSVEPPEDAKKKTSFKNDIGVKTSGVYDD